MSSSTSARKTHKDRHTESPNNKQVTMIISIVEQMQPHISTLGKLGSLVSSPRVPWLSLIVSLIGDA